jgi:hypothetical protein
LLFSSSLAEMLAVSSVVEILQFVLSLLKKYRVPQLGQLFD